MNTIATDAVVDLSDADLLAHTQRAAGDERHATARLIALLAEVDARKLYLGEGFPSLFTYCTGALHLSEHAAYGRIEAARTARSFPIVLEQLECGEITLTAIGLLRPHLTVENHRDVLDRAKHQPKHAIEHLVAALHPRPDVPSTLRRLPTRTASVPSAEPTPVGVTAPVAPCQPPCGRATPLAPERYKIQFTVDRATYEQLRHAQDLMRHAVPSGDPAIIFARALTMFVRELERTKMAQVEKPQGSRATGVGSRHIPADVKRAVWKRDNGRCAFEGAQGRCRETGFLEFHHVRPFADGGIATVDNIDLRCHAHNAYEAKEYVAAHDVLFSWELDTAQ